MTIGQQQQSLQDHVTDQQLMAGAVAGDATAWDALVDRHAQSMWTAVIDSGLDPSHAAEVCALTWLRCVDHLDELCGQAEIGDWLLATAGHECRRQQAEPASRVDRDVNRDARTPVVRAAVSANR
jgi:DNA-directed RNA polymerase specialized sigma24 family protein